MLFGETPPPPWLAWGIGLLGAGLAAAVAWGFAALSTAIALRPFRRSDDLLWTERARLAWPAREGVSSNALLSTFMMAGLGGLVVAPLLGLPPRSIAVIWAFAALNGVLIRSRSLGMELIRPDSGEAEGRRRAAFLWFFFSPHLFTWMLIIAIIPGRWGPTSAAIFGAGLLLLLIDLRGGWVSLSLRLGLLRPAPARLTALVERASILTGVRAREVAVLDTIVANALALPFSGKLIFTGHLLEILDDDEVTAVTVHELAHLDESPAVRLTRAFPALIGPGLVAIGLWIGTSGPEAIPFAGLAVSLSFLILLLSNRVARRMEVRSDRHARAQEANPGTYARALEKLHEANLIPAVMRQKRMVHPNLYDRMIAAGVQPGYPRPAPPKGPGFAIMPVFAAFLLSSLVIVLAATLPQHSPSAEDAQRREARQLAEDANVRSESGDVLAAEALLRKAEALDERSPYYPAYLAAALVYAGRCEEARPAFARAKARLINLDGDVHRDFFAYMKALETSVRDCSPARDDVGGSSRNEPDQSP